MNYDVMTDAEIRLRCLEAAVKSKQKGTTPAANIGRAKSFYRAITGREWVNTPQDHVR